MPELSRFYGVVIKMYYNDHNPPHFHARYGNARALIRISDGQIMGGELPPTARKLLENWASMRRRELEENWQRARTQQPLERIAGPDADE